MAPFRDLRLSSKTSCGEQTVWGRSIFPPGATPRAAGCASWSSRPGSAVTPEAGRSHLGKRGHGHRAEGGGQVRPQRSPGASLGVDGSASLEGGGGPGEPPRWRGRQAAQRRPAGCPGGGPPRGAACTLPARRRRPWASGGLALSPSDSADLCGLSQPSGLCFLFSETVMIPHLRAALSMRWLLETDIKTIRRPQRKASCSAGGDRHTDQWLKPGR